MVDLAIEAVDQEDFMKLLASTAPAVASRRATYTKFLTDPIAESGRHIAAAGSPATLTALPVGDDGPKTLRWVHHKIDEMARRSAGLSA